MGALRGGLGDLMHWSVGTFCAPEIMIAVFLCVAVPLAPFALYHLFFYKRLFNLNYRVHQPIDVVDFFLISFLFYIDEK